MQPLISICLPVFNGGAFLPSAIESALNQTHENFEFLIADDCSADDSFDIIQNYAKQDSRIKHWRNDQRLGLFANYNACLSRAQGEFIKLHAQDDLWEPTMVSRCLSVLQAHANVALVSTRRRLIDKNGSLIPHDGSIITAIDLLGAQPFYPAFEIISLSLEPLQNFIGEPCTVMFRKESIASGFATEFRHIGDLEYWLRILQHGDYAFLNEDLAYFRKHSRSTTAANNAQMWLASDIVHMSYMCEADLRKMGKSRQRFVRDSLHWLSCQLNRLIDCGELNEKNLHKDPLLRREDLNGLKEALFHTMLVLSDHSEMPRTEQSDTYKVLRNELTIRKLEADVRRAISSPSWTWTRGLREINSLISGKNSKPQIAQSIAGLDPQQQYIDYLRRTLRRVFKSRSWKLTQSLRQQFKRVAPRPDNCRLLTQYGRSRQDLLSSAASAAPSQAVATVTTASNKLVANAAEFRTGSAPQAASTADLAPPPKHHLGPRYQHQLAIGAIIQNEASFLREWLEFHTLVGVDKFYLFDNLSTDAFQSILQPYINDGLVELFNWPVEVKSQEDFNTMQCGAYRRIVDLAAESVKWLALIDIDEFLVPVQEQTLTEVLQDYEEYGGLSVNWQMFGTSGCDVIPDDKLAIEVLTRCAERSHDANLHVKTISRPELILRITNPHYVKYVPGRLQVNEDKVPLKGSRSSHVSADRIRINHYWTRDRRTFMQSKMPAMKGYGAKISDQEIQQRLEEFNAVEDMTIQRFVPKLRERLFATAASSLRI